MRPPSPRDVVITGAGLVTPIGVGLAPTFEAWLAGGSAVREGGLGPHAPVEEPRLRVAVAEAMESQVKFLNPSGRMAVTAVAEARASAGLETAGVAPEERGLYLAQSDAFEWDCHEFRSAFDAAEGRRGEALNRQAVRRVKPFYVLESLKNNAFAFLATWLDLRGPNTSVGGLSGAGTQALVLAAQAVAEGRIGFALVVAAGHFAMPVARYEFAHPDVGLDAVPGDGAVALVLERRDRARARGADARAEILGLGVTTGDLAAAVAAALREAGLGERERLWRVGPGAAGAGPADDPERLTGCMGMASDLAAVALAAEAVARGRFPGTGGGARAALAVARGWREQAGAVVVSAPR